MATNQENTLDGAPLPQTNYQKIQHEIDSGNIREDVWVEAYAKGRGNYNKAVSFYISIRADQLYKENTTFFKRTGDSVVQQFNPSNRRGKWLLVLAVFSVGALTLFGSQPLLRANAIKKYKGWCAKARELSLPGKSPTFLLQNFGRPKEIVTTGNSVTYVYNPCSTFCFNKERYQFKVTINASTATISGWEWNAAFDVPDAL